MIKGKHKGMPKKNVLVIGGGVSGLAAALELAEQEIGVDLIEKTESPGGHAARFSCKASGECVKCGACIVVEKLKKSSLNSNIRIHTGCKIKKIENNGTIKTWVDKEGSETSFESDAAIIASGFKPFDPVNKPFGYKRFNNVITNIDLEEMLKLEDDIVRPSDKRPPKSIAFIQCVGSRDESLNHLWCSHVCCGSALRVAKKIKSLTPETEITFFYIDVQTFGKDFQKFYDAVKQEIRMVRSIPGDILISDNDCPQITFFDPEKNYSIDEIFEMVVLSIGITPGEDNKSLSELVDIKLDDSGFFTSGENSSTGIFTAGTSRGPMSIEDAVLDGGRAALEAIKYIDRKDL